MHDVLFKVQVSTHIGKVMIMSFWESKYFGILEWFESTSDYSKCESPVIFLYTTSCTPYHILIK